MKTRAAILTELNKPLLLADVEIPKLKRGQVLVKIIATGICRAQLNETKGWKGPDRFLPHLLGHEATGTIMDTGAGVEKVRKGDYVVCTWIKGVGLDGLSSQYLLDKTHVNAGAITTFSQVSILSENRVVKIPKSIPPDVGAVLGCAIPTGVGIIRNTLQVQKKSSIAIFGVGGVGSSAILGAVMTKCKQIIAIDITEEKLRFAGKLGATHAINFKEGEVVPHIRKICPTGLDYAVEASGVKEVMETAFEALSDHGKLAIAGNLRKGEKICITPFDLIKGKKIMGTWGGESAPDRDIPYYAKAYLRGELSVDKLISKKLRLEDINNALSEMERFESLGRMIIEFK